VADEAALMLSKLVGADRSILNRLFPIAYEELRARAAEFLSKERPDHTLQPTALVHESYVRLLDQHIVHVEDRQQFIAVAAQVMRHILIDHARRGDADKRGGSRQPMCVDTSILTIEGAKTAPTHYLALHEALQKLENINSLTARVLELRFFGGLTIEETAKVLGVSESSVEREWRFARAWLRDRLG